MIKIIVIVYYILNDVQIKEMCIRDRLNIVQVTKGKDRDFKREFKETLFEKTSWLCGCEATNKLYCFPCLLFAKQSSENLNWIKYGVNDLGHLLSKIKKHECSQTHLNSLLEFNLVGKVDICQQLNSAYRRNVKEHTEKVEKNRYALSKIIL